MSTDTLQTTPILTELRALMKRYQLDAFVIPSEDYHDSEYLADCDKRRHFLTKFTGSAGIAVVTKEEALLWTDGRYHLQASQQLDDNWTLMKSGVPEVPRPSEWLSTKMPVGSAIGVDARQVTNTMYEVLRKAIEDNGRRIRPISGDNLVDLVWHDRPPRPCNPLLVISKDYSGESTPEKIERIREKLKKDCCYGLVITALDEIAWVFNLRGSDIPHNPVFFSFAIVTLKSIHLCIDKAKVSDTVRQHLTDAVTIHDYNGFSSALQDVIRECENYSPSSENGVEVKTGDKRSEAAASGPWRIWVPSQADQGTLLEVPQAKRQVKMSPVASMKAVKNATEIKHMRAAHVEDAVALCEYLLWLEENVGLGKEGDEPITEWTAAKTLDGLRSRQASYISLSFDTISSIGPNGAIIHYKPKEKTARVLNREQLYLVDSGGQYMAGTTDVTRTIHLGTPTDEERLNFTRVLKGHMALSRSIFPTNTVGSSIDCLARLALWKEGLDYSHGTGHGVGAFLNVHEGPCGISGSRASSQEEGVKEGMMLTIEPGYYKEGAYGIRIENVCQVVKAETPHCFNNRQPLTFEPITFVPIQTKLIDPRLLDEEEMAWLNAYHAQCLEVVGPALKDQGKEKVYKWLLRETQPIG